MASNPYGAITEVPGIQVGHAERIGDGWLSGVTAVIPPPGTIGAVDVRGGGPGTRETDALAPGTLVDTVDAITLTGGSAFGLASATGAQRWCEEQGRGVPIRPGLVVPVVPAAVVFDLGKGGDPQARPDAEMGYAAAAAAAAAPGDLRTGCCGAGTGTTLGHSSLKGGIGTACIHLPGGVVVGALAVVNAFGSPCVPGSAALLAAQLVRDKALRPRTPDPDEDATARGTELPIPLNTTLAVVATNARLTHPQTLRMAAAGQDGIARAIRPAHTLVDGDSVFGLATGEIDPAEAVAGIAAMPTAGGSSDSGTANTPWPIGGVAAVQAAAADAVALAILDGILAATGVSTPAVTIPAYLERYPSARPPAYPA
ncbi:P1 family peptidase [Flindersiella endophytica]